MSNVIDAQIQQNALFYNIDTIYDKIISDRNLRPSTNFNIILFNEQGLNNKITRDEAGALMINQGHIFSGFSAPTEESAKELFSDPKTDDFFIDSGYDIEHNIIVFLPVDDNDPQKVQPYYFNIDETNRLVNPDGQNGSFFISKVEIINKSKDAFTIRSNYQIILKIAFNYFEDLKDIKIKVKPLQSGLSDKEICLLQILYPAYRINTPSSANDAIKNRNFESKDKFGLVLNQALNMNDKKYFAKTIDGLDQKTKIHKNYHLTYLKHEFEMFKSNYAVMIPFENELTINYIAFEADPKPQVDQDKQQEDFFTSNINKNLYELIFNEDEGRHFFYSLGLFNESIKNLEAAIVCIKQGAPLSDLLKDGNVKQLNNNFGNASKQDFITEARKLIKDLKESIQYLKRSLNLLLYQKIMKTITVFETDITNDELVDYESSNFWEEWTKAFADGFSTAAGVGASIGLFAGPEGAIVGSAVGTFGAGAVGAYKAWTTAGEVYEQSLITLRKAFKSASIVKSSGNQLSNLSPEVNIYYTLYDKSVRDYRINYNTKYILDEAEKNIKNITELTIQENELKNIFKLKYTLFGELLNMLYEITDAEMVLGGKCVPVDDQFGQKFINYYYIPIAEAALIKFLKSKILDRDNFFYPIEEFVKDITENLLKNAVITKNKPNQFFKEYVPTTINTYSFPYIRRNISDTNFFKFKDAIQKNMLDADNVKNAKKEVVSRNYINPADPTKINQLGKYYAIIGSEEIKYTDFYKIYTNSFRDYAPVGGVTFQDHIIKKYFMPCLRIKTVDTFGSILKTKNLNFKRMDNQNLQTALMLDGSPIFRVPYEIEGEFKAYMFFFLDIAGMIFVSPPDKKDGSFNPRNTFGYSGLYLIKSCKFEYTFQNANGMSISAPNNTAKVLYGGYMLSYGDAYSATPQEQKLAQNNVPC